MNFLCLKMKNLESTYEILICLRPYLQVGGSPFGWPRTPRGTARTWRRRQRRPPAGWWSSPPAAGTSRTGSGTWKHVINIKCVKNKFFRCYWSSFNLQSPTWCAWWAWRWPLCRSQTRTCTPWRPGTGGCPCSSWWCRCARLEND